MNTSFATLNGVDRVEYFGSLEQPSPILGQVITHHKIDWNIIGFWCDRATGKMKFSCTRSGAPIQLGHGGYTQATHDIIDGRVVSLYPEPSDDVFADETDYLEQN
jgi:hypothetical protein